MKRQDAPPTLEERYAVASSTSDLGLPHGEGAGAQGILAAAAWTEVHLGSALRRLRTQWENARPRKKVPRSRAQLVAIGFTSKQAKTQHVREAVSYKLTHEREKREAKLRIPEYRRAWDGLMERAVKLGCDRPDALAMDTLDRWLDDPASHEHLGAEAEQLWSYLDVCFKNAVRALRQGVGGDTNNHPADCTCDLCCA